MTELQARFVTLERQRKELLDQFDAALQAVAEETGIGNYFQDDEQTVYKIVAPTGRWVKFDAVSYLRTKREGEDKGTLSVKEAKEHGFEV